jgi:hypothetical protein
MKNGMAQMHEFMIVGKSSNNIFHVPNRKSNKNPRKTNKKSVKSKQKKINKRNLNIKWAKSKQLKNCFLFEFYLIIVWIPLLLCLDFPDSFKIPGNPKQKSDFVFGFRRF